MSLTHMALYDRLFEGIVSGEYQAGLRLKEMSLAEKFRISRTPVREALRLLAADGLVRLLPNRGARVVGLTADDVEEIFDIRKALEMLAVECAAPVVNLHELGGLRARIEETANCRSVKRHAELDAALHGFVLKACRRPRLAAILDHNLRLMREFRYLGFRDAGVIQRAARDHLDIVDGLFARDPERAKAAVARHIEATKRTVLAHIAAKGRA